MQASTASNKNNNNNINSDNSNDSPNCIPSKNSISNQLALSGSSVSQSVSKLVEYQTTNVVLHGQPPWGFSLKGGREYNKPITITRIEPNQTADQCGLRVSDELIAVNNTYLTGYRKEAITLVTKLPFNNLLELTVRRKIKSISTSHTKVTKAASTTELSTTSKTISHENANSPSPTNLSLEPESNMKKHSSGGGKVVPPRWAPLQPNRPSNAIAVVRPQAAAQKIQPVAPRLSEPVKPPNRTTSINELDDAAAQHETDPKRSLPPQRQLWKTPSNSQYYVDPPNAHNEQQQAFQQAKQKFYYQEKTSHHLPPPGNHHPPPEQQQHHHYQQSPPQQPHHTQPAAHQQSVPSHHATGPGPNHYPPPQQQQQHHGTQQQQPIYSIVPPRRHSPSSPPPRSALPPDPHIPQQQPAAAPPDKNPRKYGILDPNEQTIHRSSSQAFKQQHPKSGPPSSRDIQPNESGRTDFHCNPQEYSDVIKNMQRKVLGVTSLAEQKQAASLRAASMNMGFGKPKMKKSGSVGTSLIQPAEEQQQTKPNFKRCNSSSGSTSSDSMSKEDVQSHLLDFVNRNSGRISIQPHKSKDSGHTKRNPSKEPPDKLSSKRDKSNRKTSNTLPRQADSVKEGRNGVKNKQGGGMNTSTASSLGNSTCSSNENILGVTKAPKNHNMGVYAPTQTPSPTNHKNQQNVKNLISNFNRGLTTTSFSSGGSDIGSKANAPVQLKVPKHSQMNSMSSTSSASYGGGGQPATNHTQPNLPSSKQSSIASSGGVGSLTLAHPPQPPLQVHHTRSGSTPMRLSTNKSPSGVANMTRNHHVSSLSQSSLLENDSVFVENSVSKDNSRSLGVLKEHSQHHHHHHHPLPPTGHQSAVGLTKSTDNMDLSTTAVYRRKTSSMKRNESLSNQRTTSTTGGTTLSQSKSMPRSASVSNFRQTNHRGSHVTSQTSNKNESSSSNNSLNSPNPLRVASMPKLNRSDSLPRRNHNKVEFDQLPPPPESEQTGTEQGKISGAITALPASSNYYNISASRARLLCDGHTPPNTPDNKTNQQVKAKVATSEQITSTKLDRLKKENNTERSSGSSTIDDGSEKETGMAATIKQSANVFDKLNTAAVNYEQESDRKIRLLKSVRKRIGELGSFRDEIEEDIQDNNEIGESVKGFIYECGTERDVERFTLVVRDLEPTIGLIFGLSGRLKRCERVLELSSNSTETTSDETHLLLQKREQLETQLQEAQKIKLKVEKRRDELAERLQELLTPADFESFEGFLRQKVQLFQQQVELDDKIKLGEEQLNVLRQNMTDVNVDEVDS